MIRLIFVVMIFMPVAARGATCDAGYYLSNGECVICNQNSRPYYCPGDDIRYPCPKTDTDYNQFGYIFVGGGEGAWASTGATSAQQCMCDMDFIDEHGNGFLLENQFNGTNYWGTRRLWRNAGSGYYLSSYWWSSGEDWYHGVKPCTNAPEYAHYTGPGTPDAKNGSVVDANDCPWECDDGYSLHDDACVPLCGAGVRYIKTGGGLVFNLYPVAYSSPALAVRNSGTVCYGVLTDGTAVDAININIGGQVYHVEN